MRSVIAKLLGSMHDGTLVSVRKNGPDEIQLNVDLLCLVESEGRSGQSVVVTLLGDSSVTYQNLGKESTTDDLKYIQNLNLEILSADDVDDGVEVLCSEGLLHVRAKDVEVAWSSGEPVSPEVLFAALDRAVRKHIDHGKRS